MQVVTDLAAVVGVALEDLAGMPVLDQPLSQGQAAEATAGDEDVQRFGGGHEDLLRMVGGHIVRGRIVRGASSAGASSAGQPVEE